MDFEDVKIAVKTAVFEGPLSLLLHLVEKRKLFINDISLAEVADEYIEKIKALPEIPVDESTQFLMIASTLLLIKSRSLLPNFQVTEEEKQDIDELKTRLNALAIYRLGGEHIDSIFEKNILVERKLPKKKREVVFAPGPITLENITHALHEFIITLPKIDKRPKVSVVKTKTLEETIDILATRVMTALRSSFNEFAKNASDSVETHKEKRVTVILSFLALLELVKRGVVSAEQKTKDDDITIESTKLDTPRYDEV